MSHDHDHEVSELEVRTRALEPLLYEKGLLTPAALDTRIGAFERDLGPLNGARVVARAWVGPDYKRRLLADGSSAIAELGFGGLQAEHLVVVERTRPTSTTSSSARSAPATRSPFWGCRRAGTKETEGLSEDGLTQLVTRDSMIGTAPASAPVVS
jgi:hypothetical protein